jgi:Aspartyl protease
MTFVRPIKQIARYGSLLTAHVKVPLLVYGTGGITRSREFIFDTGCEVTMVSEDVAAQLRLPPDDGTRRVHITSTTGFGGGRLVDVRFRFPITVSGTPGLEVTSTWVVLSGRTDLALLGFQEVHRHFSVKTFEFDVYFVPWPALTGR